MRVYCEVLNDVENSKKIIYGILNWSTAKIVLRIKDPIKSKY